MIKKIWDRLRSKEQLDMQEPVSSFIQQTSALLAEYNSLFDGESDYTLHKPLTREQVAQFEQKANTTLPEDYRDFLIHMGNGGKHTRPFPLSLSHASDALLSCTQAERVDESYMGVPFDPYKCRLCFDDSLDAIDDDIEESTYNEMLHEAFYGTVTLYNDGCGYYDFLVVTGEHRGKVYAIDTCHGQGIREKADSFEAYFLKFLNYQIEERRAKTEHHDKFDCYITEVIPGGNVRDLIVTLKEQEKTFQFEYFAPQEFLPKGNISKLNQVHDTITISLFMEDRSYSNVTVTKLSATTAASAVEEAKTPSDLVLVGDRSEHIIVGQVKRRFNYGRLRHNSFPVFIASLQQEILIISDQDVEHQIGDWLKIKGRLNGEIYKVIR